jgi:hypothetical protein
MRKSKVFLSLPRAKSKTNDCEFFKNMFSIFWCFSIYGANYKQLITKDRKSCRLSEVFLRARLLFGSEIDRCLRNSINPFEMNMKARTANIDQSTFPFLSPHHREARQDSIEMFQVNRKSFLQSLRLPSLQISQIMFHSCPGDRAFCGQNVCAPFIIATTH